MEKINPKRIVNLHEYKTKKNRIDAVAGYESLSKSLRDASERLKSLEKEDQVTPIVAFTIIFSETRDAEGNVQEYLYDTFVASNPEDLDSRVFAVGVLETVKTRLIMDDDLVGELE